MRDEVVLDASVVADWLLPGPRSRATIRFMRLDARRIAPALIFVELASVAIKVVRRGFIPDQVARDVVERLPKLLDEVAPVGDLARPAYDLATRYGFSAYDAVYVALALRRGVRLVTADGKLARRATDVGFAAHIHLLTPES